MKTVNIVLIEDNPADVFLIEMALQRHHIDCYLTKFENGEDAVNFLCSPTDNIDRLVPDAILLDLNTPKSDGLDVLGELRGNKLLAEVPIAIISSSQARSDKHGAQLRGATRYIEKPSQLADFLRTVGLAVKEMLHGPKS